MSHTIKMNGSNREEERRLRQRRKKHTVIVDECQQDKCYMESVLEHMECDAKEKYTFYAKNVNDGAGRTKNKSFYFHFAGPIILIH